MCGFSFEGSFGNNRGHQANGKPRPSKLYGMAMYRAVTRKIEVTVTPRFVSERSSPSNRYFFWAYTINITNLGGETVQLKTRHWRITDAHGRLQEVKGPGVVGEEPVLKPTESFEYTSGVPLPTPSGFMRPRPARMRGRRAHMSAIGASSRPFLSSNVSVCAWSGSNRTCFSGPRARRKEMCRLAGRHFFHFIAGPCAVNTPAYPLNS